MRQTSLKYLFVFIYLVEGEDNYFLALNEFRMPSVSLCCLFLGKLWAVLLKRLRQEVSNKGSQPPVIKALGYYQMYLALRNTWEKGLDSVNCAQYPVIFNSDQHRKYWQGQIVHEERLCSWDEQNIFSEGGECPFISSLGKRHDLMLDIVTWGPEHHRSKNRCSDVVSMCSSLQVSVSLDRIYLQD